MGRIIRIFKNINAGDYFLSLDDFTDISIEQEITS